MGDLPLYGIGNNLDNRITGSIAANTLSGGRGSDTLDGGRGDDILRGGADNDQFVFGYTYNNDRIQHFDVDGDIVAFDQRVFADADADAVLAAASQIGEHVLIDAGIHGALLLEQTLLSSLAAADFIFF